MKNQNDIELDKRISEGKKLTRQHIEALSKRFALSPPCSFNGVPSPYQ